MNAEERNRKAPVVVPTKGYSIDSLSDGSRALTLGTLVFLANLVLGSKYLPTEFYFWAIGCSRLGLALLLTFIPRTSAGQFRPLLLGLSLVALLPGSASLGALIVFYLLLEVTVETLTIDQSTEQDVPLQLGVLAALRTAGLWLGLLIQNAGWRLPLDSEEIRFVSLIAMLLFWLAVRERRSDSYLPDRLEQRIPALATLKVSLREGTKKWSLFALLNLFAVALLSGSAIGGVLPYPLLHPDQAPLWLSQTLFTLKVLLAGLAWTFFLEKLGLSHQLLVTSLGSLVYLILPFFSAGEFQLVFLGMLFFAILISCKAVLRETFKIPASLRSSLVVTLWIIGCLCGEYTRRYLAPSTLESVQVALGAIHLFFALASFLHYTAPAGKVVAPPPRSERFGDRKLDFEAAPQPKPKKKSRFFRSLSTQLFVNLPVKLFLAVAFSITILSLDHLWREKNNFKKQMEISVKVLQTKLLLSSLERRLREDMLASQRVPTDWSQFMATNFHHSGKPLDDKDPWGIPLRFQNRENIVLVTSAGADCRFDTADDLEQEIKKPAGVK